MTSIYDICWRVYALHKDGREKIEDHASHGSAMLAWSRYLTAGWDAEIWKRDAEGNETKDA